MQFITQLLFTWDKFAYYPQLMYKGESYLSSRLSKFLSIIFYAALGFAVTIEIINHSSAPVYSVSDQTTLDDPGSVFKVDSDNMQIAFQFRNDDLNEQFNKYFDLYIIYWPPFEEKPKHIGYHRCNGLDINPDVYNREAFIDKAWCFSQGEVELVLDWYIAVQFQYCESQRNPACLDNWFKDTDQVQTFFDITGGIITELNIFVFSKKIEYSTQDALLVTKPTKFTINHVIYTEIVTITDVSIQKIYFNKDKTYYTYVYPETSSTMGYSIDNHFDVAYSKFEIENYANFTQDIQKQVNRLIKTIRRIVFVPSENKRIVSVDYEDVFDMVVRIQVQAALIILAFAVLAEMYNENKFYAKIVQNSLGKKIKFKWYDIFNKFDIEKKLSEKEFAQLQNELDIVNIAKTNAKLKFLTQTLFSEKQQKMLQIMRLPPDDLNTFMEQLQSDKKLRLSKFSTDASSLQKKTDFVRTHTNTQKVKAMVLTKLKGKFKIAQMGIEDSEEARKQDIEMTNVDECLSQVEKKEKNLKALKIYLKSIKFNERNLSKNLLDTVIEKEFNNYVEQQFKVETQYNQNEKLQEFQQRSLERSQSLENPKKNYKNTKNQIE